MSHVTRHTSHVTHHTCSHTSLLANTRPPSRVLTMLYSAAVVHRLQPHKHLQSHARTHTHTNAEHMHEEHEAANLLASLLQVRAMRISASHTCSPRHVHTPHYATCAPPLAAHCLSVTSHCAQSQLTVSWASKRAPICCRPILEKQLLMDCGLS
jgi:hypothetical protein